MKRRSLSVRIFVVAIVLFFATIALFTKILIPAERIILDALSGFILGTQSVTRFITNTIPPSDDKIRIIARRADEFQNTFIISKSAPEGTKVTQGNILVGVVTAQGNLASRIEAITAPGFIIHGIISRSGVPAEFQGKGAMLLETRLPRGVDVQKGDTVLEDQGVPLGIGSVVDIIDVASDPFVTIIVQNPVNLYTLSFIEIQEEAPNIL